VIDNTSPGLNVTAEENATVTVVDDAAIVSVPIEVVFL
jgi:hypothetical protein